jgi:hypothetical protein
MPLGPTIISAGNIQSSFILTVSITAASTNANTTAEQTFTIPGLQLGDILTVSPQFALSTLLTVENARVSAANTIAIAINNSTAGALTYPAGSFAIEVNRPYPGLSMTAIQ